MHLKCCNSERLLGDKLFTHLKQSSNWYQNHNIKFFRYAKPKAKWTWPWVKVVKWNSKTSRTVYYLSANLRTLRRHNMAHLVEVNFCAGFIQTDSTQTYRRNQLYKLNSLFRFYNMNEKVYVQNHKIVRIWEFGPQLTAC